MIKMQGGIYNIDDVEETRVKLGMFWFSKLDITENLKDKPYVHVDNVKFNPDNLDL